MQIPTDIIENIKSIDCWSFDCFGLNAKSKNQALKYVTFELMNRYGLLSKFKIPLTYMEVRRFVRINIRINHSVRPLEIKFENLIERSSFFQKNRTLYSKLSKAI